MARKSPSAKAFIAVRDALALIAKVSNRTYVEINIIAYFILIPGSWLALPLLVCGALFAALLCGRGTA